MSNANELPIHDDGGRAKVRTADLACLIEDSLNEIYVFEQTSLRFIVVNRSARNNLGYSMDELEQLTPIDIKPDYTEQAFRDVIAPLCAGTRERIVFETTHLRKDETSYPVEVHLQAGSYGDVPVCTAIILDISERQAAREAQRAFEEQLRLAQKLESLGVLAGGIAHDFNNILTSILGHADLARREFGPESRAYDHLNEVVSASERAAELTQQMLAYSGKGRFIVQPLDLATLIKDMHRLLEVSISKRCVISYHSAADLPAVEADATQLRQVVMNLVINASEAIGDEGGSIAVTTGVLSCDAAYLADTLLDEQLPEGRYVTLEVADSGCGMTEETRLKLFDPFFTTKFTGRGLGLAATLGIVRGHKGAIKIYSELGRGTTFNILLPASEKVASEGIAHVDQHTSWRTSGLALVVDDEEAVSKLARRMLEEMGFTVMTAADGRQGVDVFAEHHEELRLVLLDMTMPRLDGEQAFREMRRIRGNVPTILSSGYNQQTATNRFAGKGLAGFIQKPYRYAQLLEIVRSVIV